MHFSLWSLTVLAFAAILSAGCSKADDITDEIPEPDGWQTEISDLRSRWKQANLDGEHEKIIEMTRPYLQEALRRKDTVTAINCLLSIAQAYIFIEDKDSVKAYLDLSEKLDNGNIGSELSAMLDNILGIYTMKFESDYSRALEYFLSGYSEIQGTDNYRNQIAFLGNIVSIFYTQSDPNGLTYAREAWALANDCEMEDFSLCLASISMAQMLFITGETFALEAEISPEHSAITWETSNPAIATVDGNGNITAINEGTAEISATSGETSATCLVTVAAAPQIGDFYYSDGTWSSELDGSKTPIAVVFYTGDPSVNDAAMQNEKPWCTHGLAVSLDLLENYGYAAWQTNYTEYGGEVGSWIKANTQYETTFIHPSEENSALLNYILGYNNTKGIEAFNYVPEHYDYLVDAVQYITDYRKQCPAPAASSDWYLPSVIELLYIGTNDIPDGSNIMNDVFPLNTIYTVNESVEKTGGLPVEISSRPYLSSMESVSGSMHVVLFASVTEKAGAFTSDKNVALHNIRPVLAF